MIFQELVIFPDNGIISQAYDSRVSQNDMLRVAQKLMHQAPAYVREENLVGQGVYVWGPDFIAMIDESFLNGTKANFSVSQLALFNSYITFLQDGITASTPEAVIALDTYLGSR